MTPREAAQYRYLNDAMFHTAVDQIAKGTVRDLPHHGVLNLPLGELRRLCQTAAVGAILDFVAATGQVHQMFQWQALEEVE